jgi:hypothetical protein
MYSQLVKLESRGVKLEIRGILALISE